MEWNFARSNLPSVFDPNLCFQIELLNRQQAIYREINSFDNFNNISGLPSIITFRILHKFVGERTVKFLKQINSYKIYQTHLQDSQQRHRQYKYCDLNLTKLLLEKSSYT